jgi:hypothetical protein
MNLSKKIEQKLSDTQHDQELETLVLEHEMLNSRIKTINDEMKRLSSDEQRAFEEKNEVSEKIAAIKRTVMLKEAILNKVEWKAFPLGSGTYCFTVDCKDASAKPLIELLQLDYLGPFSFDDCELILDKKLVYLVVQEDKISLLDVAEKYDLQIDWSYFNEKFVDGSLAFLEKWRKEVECETKNINEEFVKIERKISDMLEIKRAIEGAPHI